MAPPGLTPEDEEALARVRQVCQSMPRADEGELQNRPLFRVGNRRFALFNGVGSPPRPRWMGSGRSLHFLADPLDIDALRQDARFGPSPHHGNRGWLALRLDQPDVDWVEVAELLHSAYRQVAGTHGAAQSGTY
jgi:predicted DNA-binding protein (MmcQ/YjbR family)